MESPAFNVTKGLEENQKGDSFSDTFGTTPVSNCPEKSTCLCDYSSHAVRNLSDAVPPVVSHPIF